MHRDLSIFLTYARDSIVKGRETAYFQGNDTVGHITKSAVFSSKMELL